MHDAHIHIKNEIQLKQFLEYQIPMMINVQNIDEYEMIKRFHQTNHHIYMSIGIHPWQSNQEECFNLIPYMQNGDCIGEIGLDNIWCDVDIQIQMKIFEKQLQIALDLGKSVILHTKGMEKECLEMIKKYPNRYLVHWYSCKQYIEDYINLGCYFSVGPSIGRDQNVDLLVDLVDLDHLLLESDGIDALSWAYDENITVDRYVSCLKNSVEKIAEYKSMGVGEVYKALDDNFHRFISKNFVGDMG